MNWQFLDYSTGAVLSELEPELEPHYNTAAAYFPSALPASKDFVVTTSTDKGIVKVLDRNKKTSAATYRDAAGSGDAICIVYKYAVFFFDFEHLTQTDFLV